MPQPKSSFRRRLVGEALRFVREQIDLSMPDAAEILDCHISKISRIENGYRGISRKELRELLSEYDTADAQADLLQALLGYDSPDPQFHWWRKAAEVLPSSLLDYAMVEEHASAISAYGATLIPPLLRTRAYTWAVALMDPWVPEPALDAVADTAPARQAMILETHAATVDVVIAEEALHRQVGDHDVMRKQLHRLLEIADRRAYPQVTIQVLPCTSGPTPLGDSGGLSILGFKALSRLGAVYLDGPGGGRCLHHQAEVADYAKAFHETQQAALPINESRRFLDEVATSTDADS